MLYEWAGRRGLLCVFCGYLFVNNVKGCKMCGFWGVRWMGRIGFFLIFFVALWVSFCYFSARGSYRASAKRAGNWRVAGAKIAVW